MTQDIMPAIGTVWMWSGKQYDVIGVFGMCITLREIGAREVFTQCLIPVQGTIASPSK